MFKRGKKGMWWVTYRLPNGRWTQQSAKTTNKRAAQKVEDSLRAASAEGRLRVAIGVCPTLREFGEKYIAGIGHANTRRRYTSSLNMLRPTLGEAKLSTITSTRIGDYAAARCAAGKRSATVNRDLAFLRRVLKVARKRRLIVENPFEEVDFLEERKERRKPYIIGYEEEERLAAAADAPLRALIVLLIETGLRVGREAYPLRWSDVDLDVGALTVVESKTDAGRRQVPLSDRCRGELRQWRKTTGGPKFSPWVFPNMDNPACHITTMRRAWATAVKRAKLKPFRMYDLRAAFASRLLAVGQTDLFVAQMLGHATAAIVGTYAKAVTDFQRDAIERMEAQRRRHTVRTAQVGGAL